jgi:hypothetical protein
MPTAGREHAVTLPNHIGIIERIYRFFTMEHFSITTESLIIMQNVDNMTAKNVIYVRLAL